MRTLLLVSTLVFAAVPLEAQRRPITAAEIEKAGAIVTSAFDAVNALRPRWLQAPREMGTQGLMPRIHVYQDDHDMGDTEYLKTIPAEHVANLRWYSANEAGSRFGPSEGPVIEVTLKPSGH